MPNTEETLSEKQKACIKKGNFITCQECSAVYDIIEFNFCPACSQEKENNNAKQIR